MAFKIQTTTRHESTTCPGVVFQLWRMTDARRSELRKQLGSAQRRIRVILREQDKIQAAGENQDYDAWLVLEEEYHTIMGDQVHPIQIKWGVKSIEGLLDEDDNPVGVEQCMSWPSVLLEEVVGAVQEEMGLNGAERKNSELPTTGGEVGALAPSPLTVASAESVDTGKVETVASITPTE